MFDHHDETGPMLALVARMAIALGCEAGMVNKETLCIELSYGQQLTWHVPEPHQSLFAGLPPYTRSLTPVDGGQRTQTLNAALAMPKGWLLGCVSQLEELGEQGSTAWRTVLATDVWRKPELRQLAPNVAAEIWYRDVNRLGQWVARYADLMEAEEARHYPVLQSAPDDFAEGARVEALTPQHETFSPEEVFAAVQALRQAKRLPATEPDAFDIALAAEIEEGRLATLADAQAHAAGEAQAGPHPKH